MLRSLREAGHCEGGEDRGGVWVGGNKGGGEAGHCEGGEVGSGERGIEL